MPKKETKIVVMIDVNYSNYDIERKVLSKYDLKLIEISSIQEHIKLLNEADAVLVREFPLTKNVIEKLNNCKVIVRYGVGVDNIDLQAATKRGIYVANVPDYGTEEVSNHALALLLSVSRRVVTRNHDVKNGKWNIGDKEPIYSFRGKTLGIVGFGRIGKAFYEKSLPFGFQNILIYDPYIKETPPNTTLVSIEELMSISDVISLHLPLTKHSYHILNAKKLDLAKENAIIINTARGGLIDEVALEKFLSKGKFYGVGLDVMEEEPPNIHHPLFQYKNVIVTDHCGWYSEESLLTLKEKAAQNVLKVFSGEQPHYWVNRWED